MSVSVDRNKKHREQWLALTAHTTVGQLMLVDFPRCDYDDPAAKAARLLLESNLPALPVLREERAIGVVSRADLLQLAYAEMFAAERDFMLSKSGDLISEVKFTTVTPETELAAALKIVAHERQELLVVVTDGLPVGVLNSIELIDRLVGLL